MNDIEARIAALGRPGMSLAGWKAIAQSLERTKAWDIAHPELAAEYRRLVADLERQTAENERTERQAAAAAKVLRTQGAKLERSGVGQRSLEAAANPQPSEALSVVQRWLPDASLTWLVLCGDKGTGKSVAATWAVREAIRSGGTAAFLRASELAKLSGFDAGAAELEHLKRVHLLVLDDVGTELLTDHARAQLHELADHRHENYARTILTSNLRWKGALETRLGERIADRVAQAGRIVQIAPERSLRRPGKPPEAA